MRPTGQKTEPRRVWEVRTNLHKDREGLTEKGTWKEVRAQHVQGTYGGWEPAVQ